MLSCTATVVAAFAATVGGAPRPTLGSGLPHVGLGILLLLALTSPAARAYALRWRSAPGPASGSGEVVSPTLEGR